MTFDEILDQAIEMLRRRGRLTYRTFKRPFQQDDETLEDLTFELIEGQRLATDENGTVLVWVGIGDGTPAAVVPPNPTTQSPTIEAASSTQTEPSPSETRTLSADTHLPEAERRQLTILFADLVDSTRLSGQLDAEDYREVVHAYQAACAEVTERFECHIAQTLGDGLLIYSGYPVAHEDDAERAVRVGLGIIDVMKALNERLEREKNIRLGIRVGIHTGQVVIGEVGAGARQEQLAMGEVPNVAARIQGLAEPDMVVISDATYRLVEGYFDCESLGEQTLRGVADPIVVYRVLWERGIQSRLDVASTRGLTPLVGREQEVGILLDRWNQVKDGMGQVVLLSGEAGIGKSRAVQVLKDHVSDEPPIQLECRSSPYFTNTALYPIVDLIQRTLQFQPDDTPKKRLEKLEQELDQYRLPLEETVPLFGVLLSLSIPEDRYSPLNLTPQRQRQKTLEAIVAVMLELSEHQPVLFILEDLHWTDPTTLECLALLIEQTPTASLYILATCRPEFHPTWTHRSYLTEVTLSRLSRKQTERLAEHVADGKRLPAEVLDQIIEKTDGVPLYIEEMTKAVLESGVMKAMDSGYELRSSISTLSIPTTLQDSLMARLDRLMTAKVVAQLGATMGSQFSYALLQAVSQIDEETLQRELGRLVESELIYQRGLPPQATYTFKHALIQDTAYESLLRNTRQGYHRRIAEVLEDQFSETAETQPELLAHHYTEAGLSEQAVGYWQRASQRAFQNSGYLEALAHLNQGLSLIPTLPATTERAQHELRMQITRGLAMTHTKGHASAEVGDAYTRARTLCQQVGDTQQLSAALAGLRRFYLTRGEYHRSRDVGEELLHLAQQQDDVTILLLGYFGVGAPLFTLAEFSAARDHLEQGIALYDPQLHQTLIARYGTDLGVISRSWGALSLWHLGYPDQALERHQEAISLAHDLSHPFSLAMGLNFGLHLHHLCRDTEWVTQQAEVLTSLASAHGFQYIRVLATFFRSWGLSQKGHGEQSISQMRHGLDLLGEIGTKSNFSYHLSLLAQAYGKVGDFEHGVELLTKALTNLAQTGERHHEAEIHRLKGQLLLQQSSDNATEAEACFNQAISIAQSQSAKSWELRAVTSLAHLWQSQGKREEAHTLLAPVYGWFAEGFDTTDLKDAKSLLDTLP